MESMTEGHGAVTPPGSPVSALAGPGQSSPRSRLEPGTFRKRADRALGATRNGDFARLWAAEATSAVGSQFTAVALPLLAALSLGASPLAFGILAAAAGLPHLIFGLVAGAWVDRLRRRPVMIAADIARAVLLATIPVAAWLGALRIELLIAVAFLSEIFTVFFDIAYLSYIPSLVSRDDLVEANSRLEATASSAQVIGPALGGTLVRFLGAPMALLVDALSYIVSAGFLWRIGAGEARPVRTDAAMSLRAEIVQGLRAVWQSPVLRGLALSSTVMNLAGFLFLSIYVLYMTRDLGLGAEAVGLVFAAGGAGALLGSVTAGPARSHWGVGRVLLGAQILFGLFGMLVPLAVLFPSAALPLVVAAEFLQWVMVIVFSVNAVSLRQAITPGRMLGRVNGTMRFIVWGSRPVGSLAGGFLGSLIGLPMTLVVGAFGMLLAFVPLLVSPIPGLQGVIPEEIPHPSSAAGA
ncbi:MAG: MFS transporter [Chloroflexi bacterium]|nr:MFS transporter [Chloroflexota bacterium]